MKMSNEEVRRVLDEPRIARAASNSPDGFPYIVATWYLYKDDKLFFFCGRHAPRAAAIKRDPKIVFLIDDDHYPYRQVTIQGSGQVEKSESKAGGVYRANLRDVSWSRWGTSVRRLP